MFVFHWKLSLISVSQAEWRQWRQWHGVVWLQFLGIALCEVPSKPYWVEFQEESGVAPQQPGPAHCRAQCWQWDDVSTITENRSWSRVRTWETGWRLIRVQYTRPAAVQHYNIHDYSIKTFLSSFLCVDCDDMMSHWLIWSVRWSEEFYPLQTRKHRSKTFVWKVKEHVLWKSSKTSTNQGKERKIFWLDCF